MRTISTTEAIQDFEQLLRTVQDEPVTVRDAERDVAVLISPEAYDRLLARREASAPNPLIMKLFRENLAKRGAIYEALARWEAEHPESGDDS